MATSTEPMTLAEAKTKADDLLHHLRPFCHRIEIAGSIRREVPMVNDIEIVCTPKKTLVGLFDIPGPDNWKTVQVFGDLLCHLAPTVVRGNFDGHYQQRLLDDGTKLDLFMPRPEDFGRIFAIRTGSEEFSRSLAQRWVRMGFKGIDGRLTRTGDGYDLRGRRIEKGEIVAFETEQEFFDFLGLAYVEPRDRSV